MRSPPPFRTAIYPPSSLAFLLVWFLAWLFLSPLFGYTDMYFIAWVSHFVPDHWNIYEAVQQSSPQNLSAVTYPPLAYWSIGVWMFLGKTLFGLFQYPHWNAFFAQAPWNQAMPLRPVEIIFLKLLYLPFHLGIAAFSAALVTRGQPADDPPSKTGTRFLAQPILLFVSLFMGQLDVMPSFFCVLAAYLLARKEHPLGCAAWAFAALSAGTLLKVFPALVAAVYFILLFATPSRRRQAWVGLVAFTAPLLAVGYAVRGPSLGPGLLSLDRARVLLGVDSYPVAASLHSYALAFILVFLLLAACRWAEFQKGWNLAMRALEDDRRYRAALLLLPCLVLSAVLAERFWAVQYLAWVSPWIVILGASAHRLFPAGSLAKRMASRLPLFQNIFFFPVVLAVFHGNVDSNMCILWRGGSTLGATLQAWAGPLFLVFFSILLAAALLSAYALWGVLRWSPAPFRVDAGTSFKTEWGPFLLFLGMAAVLLISCRMIPAGLVQ